MDKVRGKIGGKVRDRVRVRDRDRVRDRGRERVQVERTNIYSYLPMSLSPTTTPNKSACPLSFTLVTSAAPVDALERVWCSEREKEDEK